MMGIIEIGLIITLGLGAYLSINALLGIAILDVLDSDEILVCAFFFPIMLIVHLFRLVKRTFKDW